MNASRTLNRREFASGLAALAALGATGCTHSAAAPPAPASLAPEAAAVPSASQQPLRAVGASRGLLAGCAVDVHALRRDDAYAALIRQQAGIVVAERAFKFGPLRPTPTTFFFADADYLAAFAARNDMKLRGHNFVWHRSLPAWFNSYVTPANAERVLVNHIETVATRYRGRIHSWDVVNEAINPPDHLPHAMRNSPWQHVLPNYIDIAFRTARQADPSAILCYNDYGIEGEDPASATKREAVLALVRGMQQRHVPIDAVGIQSHIKAGHRYGPGLVQFMQQVRELNLKLLLTEMDVNDRELPSPIPARDRAVAATYASYLRQTLAQPGVIALLTWGITDRYTWLNHEDNRKDGLPERCLPFDADLQPVPAFFAERNALAAAPLRQS